MLAALVIFVFAAANSTSAESTLRRFILAVNRGDPAGVRQNLWEAADAPISAPAISLARVVGPEYEVVNRQENENSLLLVVASRKPGTQPAYAAFVLSRNNGRWKVDAKMTLHVTQSMQSGR